MAQYAREHPGWTGVYVEFWTHASRRPELRAKVAAQHERLLATVGGLVAEWASRWGVELTLPAREVVRGVYAISRGLGLEALLADDAGTLDPFEDMFLAYVMGLIRARPGTGAPGEGRLPMTSTTSTTTSSSPADRLRALAGDQLARDGWSRDRLLELQGERLRALVAHAVAASPYYREVLGPDAAAGDVPLRELPTLSKTTMMDNFDRIVTDRRLRRADLEAHLSAPAADRPYLGRYKVFTTAGTTGVRGLFVEDVDEFAVSIGTACGAWPAGAWGRRPGWPGSAPPARAT